MRIRKLFLLANNLENQKALYAKLGFVCILKNDSLIINAGNSELHFSESSDFQPYHFCFLIPSEQLNACLEWLNHIVKPIETSDSGPVFPLDTWNAEAVYFHDADGNLVEFIARHDLEHSPRAQFTGALVVNLNEIGLPTNDIATSNAYLENQMNTKFWKGNKVRFGTNGDQYGLFLLVNPDIKPNWFPLDQVIYYSPFKAIVESDGKTFEVRYSKSTLEIDEIG